MLFIPKIVILLPYPIYLKPLEAILKPFFLDFYKKIHIFNIMNQNFNLNTFIIHPKQNEIDKIKEELTKARLKIYKNFGNPGLNYADKLTKSKTNIGSNHHHIYGFKNHYTSET